MNITPPSTSTPASSISRAEFERDDSANSAELEAKSLGDILRNSPAASLLGLPESLPEEDDAVPTPEESVDEDDPQNTDDAETDLDEADQDSDNEDADTDEDEQDSTQDTADLPSEEDIDWEYKVPVTIDGKTEYLTLDEVRKGYATDKHLSQKGREIGEQRKLIEKEREEKLSELVQLGTVFHEELTVQETELGTKYQDLSRQIEEAREVGDTYKARELKEERETVQEKYWQISNSREEKLKSVVAKIQETQQEQQKKLAEEFYGSIGNYIPDFSDKTATSIREFAVQEGIPEDLLNTIYSPVVVKFINDYRLLKTKATKGEAKRKEAPAKAIPTKRGTPTSAKQKQEDQSLRSKALTGNASGQEQLDFLKKISNVSKKL